MRKKNANPALSLSVRSEDYLEFIIKASNILASSLDYDATLESVANLAISFICDICIIDLVEKNGSIRHAAVVEAHHQQTALTQKILHSPPNPQAKQGIYEVARSGKPLLISPVTQEWINKVSRNKEDIRIYKEMNLCSQMFVPLISRGKTIGVLWLASRNQKRLYSKDDLIWAQELANRAAIAVDNARLYKTAQDAIIARDEFLSIASHELKTPLTSILLQLQIVLGSIRKESSEIPTKRLETMLENTEQQSKKLSKLINDLLNISLITTGRLTLDKEKVNFSNLVKDILRRYEEQIKKSNYDVTTEISNNIFGCWDKVRIEQVISNLISNAIKYGDHKPISIQVNKRNNQALFIIKDNGIGIATPFQKRIFERFARGVSPKHYRGLGVGLYISKNIIEAHGGSIKVKSVLRKGSLFRVELPLKN